MTSYIRVVISWVVEVMTDACSQHDADIFQSQLAPQLTQVYQSVHHLRDAETMAKVVEWIVAIVLLDAQLYSACVQYSHFYYKKLTTR